MSIDLKEKLRALRGKRTLEEFGKLLGIAYQNIQRYENGVEPKATFFDALRTKLNINIEWLFNDNAEMYQGNVNLPGSKFKNIPQLGIIEMGKPVPQWEVNNAVKNITLGDVSHLVNPVAFEAKGSSMKPWIYPGYILICEDKMPKDNDPAVVIFKSDPDTAEATLKYVKFEKNGSLILSSENNASHPPFIVHKRDIQKIYRLDRFIGKVR